MKKNYKKLFEKKLYKMDLLEDLKTLLLSFNFCIIHIIHKMLALLKNHLNNLKNSIFECILNFFYNT